MASPRVVRCQGHLTLRRWGEAEDILFLDDEPLTEVLDWMRGLQVTVRYWVTSQPATWVEAQDRWRDIVMGGPTDGNIVEGGAHVNLQSYYSEVTGYLYTDEDLVVGRHNLLHELQQAVGAWLFFEVEVHAPAAQPPPP